MVTFSEAFIEVTLICGSDLGVGVRYYPSGAPDASTLCGNTRSRGRAG